MGDSEADDVDFESEGSEEEPPSKKDKKADGKAEKKAGKEKGAKKEPAAKKGAAAAAGGGAKLSGDEEEQKVLAYMLQQNRPYGVTQVFENLHRTVKKGSVPVILDKLSEEGKLTCKMFKKVKIYLANQANFPQVSQEEVNRLDGRLVELSSQVQPLSDQVKQLQREVKDLECELTEEEMDRQLLVLGEEVKKKQNRLQEAQTKSSGAGAVSKEQSIKMQETYNKLFNEWKRRRRAVQDMIGVVLENAPPSKKPKAFMADVGVETDEEAGLDMKKYEALVKKPN